MDTTRCHAPAASHSTFAEREPTGLHRRRPKSAQQAKIVPKNQSVGLRPTRKTALQFHIPELSIAAKAEPLAVAVPDQFDHGFLQQQSPPVSEYLFQNG